MYKHKLSTLSPEDSDEVLIKQRILPETDESGNLVWKGKGKKTVDVNQIKERFKSLGINTHWDRVDKINSFRNDIEHYHSDLSKDAIRDLVSNSFIVIRDFISNELSLDPQVLLGSDSWNTLVSVAEVYQKEKEACDNEIDNIDWESDSLGDVVKSISCDNCGSSLISIKIENPCREEIVFYCKSCSSEFGYLDVIEDAIQNYHAFGRYLSFTDGDELPLITCPDCVHETYNDANTYDLTDGVYGPNEPTWEYQDDPATDFYATNISGAQRLPNGNTLVCNGPAGNFFEVKTDGTKVWEYQYSSSGSQGGTRQVNAPGGGDQGGGGQSSQQVNVFRAERYSPDYSGLEALDQE